MKFSSVLSLFALSSFAVGASLPVEKRDATSAAVDIVSGLYTDIQQYTGDMNATTAGLSANPSAAERKAATKKIHADVKGLTKLVKAATRSVKAIPNKRSVLVSRQSAGDLATIIVGVLTEISGALNGVLATLGLQALLGPLGPLVASLSLLLLALDVVVDRVLDLVRAIVDGLLIGLSLALAGLII